MNTHRDGFSRRLQKISRRDLLLLIGRRCCSEASYGTQAMTEGD
jgi:hypothetical protein